MNINQFFGSKPNRYKFKTFVSLDNKNDIQVGDKFRAGKPAEAFCWLALGLGYIKSIQSYSKWSPLSDDFTFLS